MFDPELYPTPTEVIKRMLEPWQRSEFFPDLSMDGLRVLEPSAGSGSMLDYIKEHAAHSHHSNDNGPRLHAIEHNEELRAMLSGKGYSVVHDDFLTFQTDLVYDIILMNPPFSNGERHLLKAWEILKTGTVVCLLNAETIRNPHTVFRKHLVKIIEEHGEVKTLGRVFGKAIRKTDVNVVMVTLHKKEEAHSFDWWKDGEFVGEEQKEFTFNAENVGNQVVLYDFLDGLVGHYEQAKVAYETYLKARYNLKHLLADLVPPHVSIIKEANEASGPAAKVTRYRSLLQKHAWDHVIRRTKLHDLMTESVRKNMDALVEQQGGMAFTKSNIQALLEMLFLNRHEILHQSVVEMFDRMTKYHAKNTCHWEGWKTNSAHQVNRKVIVPSYGVRYERRFGGNFSLDYHFENRLDDIDRAMASLEGRKLSDPTRMVHVKKEPRWVGDKDTPKEQMPIVTVGIALKRKFKELGDIEHLDFYGDVDNTAESEYFYLKFWKKGTLHLVFKDEALWRLFNLTAAKGKKWLPMDHDREPQPTQTKGDRDYVKALAQIATQNRLALQPATVEEEDY